MIYQALSSFRCLIIVKSVGVIDIGTHRLATLIFVKKLMVPQQKFGKEIQEIIALNLPALLFRLVSVTSHLWFYKISVAVFTTKK